MYQARAELNLLLYPDRHFGDAALDGLRVEGRQIASAHVYQGPGQPLGRGEAGSYQVGPQGFETQGAARAITAPQLDRGGQVLIA